MKKILPNIEDTSSEDDVDEYRLQKETCAEEYEIIWVVLLEARSQPQALVFRTNDRSGKQENDLREEQKTVLLVDVEQPSRNSFSRP